jgi:hypothetical protein
MKTCISRPIVFIASLAGLFGAPAFAAFGDNTAPAASTLSGDNAGGSALPPGTYPTSPSGPNNSTDDRVPAPSKTDKPAPRKHPSTKHPDSQKSTKAAPRTGS